MTDQASWRNSTTSQVLVAGVVGYLTVCLWMAFKGQLAEALAGMRWVVETALVLYGYRKGTEAGKNGTGGGNGVAQDAPK